MADKSMLKQIIVGFVEQILGLALAPALIQSINDAGFTGVTGSIASLVPALYIIGVLVGGAKILQAALEDRPSKKATGIQRGITVFVTALVGVFLAPTINTFATGTGAQGLANATFSGTIVSSIAPLVVVFYLIGILGVTISSVTSNADGFGF